MGITTSEMVIPNGIKISRIHTTSKTHHKTFTFLAFAGRHIQKRTDLLLSAADILTKQGVNLKVILVEETSSTLGDKIFNPKPNWLNEIKSQEDINTVFSQADCFVSSSVHETFSYAIAEAAIFGVPIIQSDIEGTMWNANNPSTILFKSGDIAELANAMRKVMSIS